MPEPTTTTAAAVTLAAAGATVPALTAFGVPLGLRPDLLVAGFAGALVAIVLLDSVPSTGDTLRELLRTSARRMAVAIASSLVAGYLAPMLAAAVPEPALLGSAFLAGVGAQQTLRRAIARFGAKPQEPRQ